MGLIGLPQGEIIAKCAKLKKITTKKRSDLQEQLRKLEQLHCINKDCLILEQIRPFKQEIDTILSEEVEKSLNS